MPLLSLSTRVPADAEINTPTGDEPLSLYRSNENLNVALEAAEAGGLQVVNIGATDIIQGRPASILGLTWQLIRVHLLAQINLKVSASSGLLPLLMLLMRLSLLLDWAAAAASLLAPSESASFP